MKANVVRSMEIIIIFNEIKTMRTIHHEQKNENQQ